MTMDQDLGVLIFIVLCIALGLIVTAFNLRSVLAYDKTEASKPITTPVDDGAPEEDPLNDEGA